MKHYSALQAVAHAAPPRPNFDATSRRVSHPRNGFGMSDASTTLPIGRQVSLPGHFDTPLVLGAAHPLAKGFECRVCLLDGTLDEVVSAEEEAAAPAWESKTPLANAPQLRLLVNSDRIRLAYTQDPHLAVSLSGTRAGKRKPTYELTVVLPVDEPSPATAAKP